MVKDVCGVAADSTRMSSGVLIKEYTVNGEICLWGDCRLNPDVKVSVDKGLKVSTLLMVRYVCGVATDSTQMLR